MVIKKDVDIYGMANALNEKICEAESNLCDYVRVPHGLAHDLQDLLLYMAECEENKEETKGTEQNPTSDTERRNIRKPYMYPLCLGNYCGDDTECLSCINKYICKEMLETQQNVKDMVNGIVDKAMKEDGKKDE